MGSGASWISDDAPMTPPAPDSSAFLTTRWTRICLAKVASEDGRRARAELCEAYYEPVVAFLRCELRDADAAREMSHAFFEQTLCGGRIHTADPARGLDALRAECAAEGKAGFFERVKPLLTGDAAHGAQEEVASSCGMNVAAFRMALHRLKRRLRACVKAEVAGTLEDPALVQEEMQALFAALGG